MTPEDYGRYARAMDTVSALAREEFTAIWGGLDTSKPVACKAVLLKAVPAIVDKYSKMASLVSAQFYESQREAATGKRCRARMAKPVDQEIVRAKVRYALGHLFGEGGEHGNACRRLRL